MIAFPTTPTAAVRLAGTIRAGATDVEERRRSGRLNGDVVDLRDLAIGAPELVSLSVSSGLSLGALVRVSALDTPALAPWNGLREAAQTLATPQIRPVATVGGALLQQNRCGYLRHPDLRAACYKAGGGGCAARTGDHLRHALFDTGACISVHPSTLACALIAYGASYGVQDREGTRIAGALEGLYGDGSDALKDHLLPAGTLLTGVHIFEPPRPAAGFEPSAYARATGRVWAEWPLVEAVVRRTTVGVVFSVGGVAPVPLRLRTAERAFDSGATVADAVAEECASRLILDDTRYKVQLLVGLLQHLLERTASAP